MIHICFLVYCALLLVILLNDLIFFRIDHIFLGGLLLLFPLFAFSPAFNVNILDALITGSIFFTIGASMFFLRLWGGGDAKLFGVLGLYMYDQAFKFVIVSSLIGTALALLWLFAGRQLNNLSQHLRAKLKDCYHQRYPLLRFIFPGVQNDHDYASSSLSYVQDLVTVTDHNISSSFGSNKEDNLSSQSWHVNAIAPLPYGACLVLAGILLFPR